MIYNILGKAFYPELTPWERRRRINNIIGILLVAVVSGAGVGFVIYRESFTHH